MTLYRISPGDSVLQHWKSICIKADRCVNSPGFEPVVSLLMCICTHTQCRHECEWCPWRQTLPRVGLNSKLVCSVAVLLLTSFPPTIVRRSPEELCIQTTQTASNTDDDASGASRARKPSLRAVRWGLLIRVVVRRRVAWRDHRGPQVAGSRLGVI